jgi:uncharacterized membrane protein required for colicin V production
MLLVDIILILILVGFLGRGWKSGFVDALGELIGAIIAFLVARWLSLPLAIPIGLLMPDHPGLARFIAFLLIFLLVGKLISWLFSLVAKVLKIVTSLPLISLVNKILGGITGFLTGVVFVGSAVYLVFTFRLDDRLVRWLAASAVARYTENVFSTVLRFLL